MEEKSKNIKRQKEYSERTIKEAEKEIERREKRKGRELTQKEKNRVIKEVDRKRKKRRVFGGVFLSLGIGIGAFGTNLINEYNNKGIEQDKKAVNIDMSKSDKDIKIETKNSANKVWVDGIKVDPNAEEKEIKENLREEINNLKTGEEVLNYIKEIYIEEYNKVSEEKVNISDITLYREQYMVRLDEDKAENGDKIYRISEGYKTKQERVAFPDGAIAIKVRTDKGIITEKIAEKDGEYFIVYDRKEKVEKDEKNTATKLGTILENGITLSFLREENEIEGKIDSEEEREYSQIVRNYENKLIEEIYILKDNQIKEIKGIKKTENNIEVETANELGR